MTEPVGDERAIFLAALDQPTPAQRAAYLAEACAGDPELERRVRELLASHEESRGPLDTPPSGVGAGATLDRPLIEQPGTRIGPYKLREQIGEGGMGVVYMADQKQPVERRVALKIIKPGMDTHQVVTRFEAERQALAIMDHPNIAKVLDAGTTETGRPYFVMELVKGLPITQYCDEHHLTPRQRLELLLPVCHAIQHAHQKGIIHRDIKPSNVLVAEYDLQAVPKVIDFGVAKAVGQPLTEKSLFTGFGQIVGTLEYMSPEQAKVNQLDIDTRSDIYSLGVLLYELLTGTTPFDKLRLRSAAWDEMLRIIREEDPPKPSTRLSDLSRSGWSSRTPLAPHAGDSARQARRDSSLASVAALRHTEPSKLTRLVRGELDWIVMKALEKDRNRRYETANGLAMDLQRYLSDEPVQACPPSAGYRFRKFLRRNKGPAFAVTLLFIALLAGTIGTLVALLQIRSERDQKELARQDAVAKEAKAVAAAREERRAREAEAVQRSRAEAVAALLESIFREVDPRADWTESTELRVRLLDRLDETAAQLDEKFSGDPQTRAHLQNTLAETQLTLGEPAKALALLEPALKVLQEQLGDENPDVLQGTTNVARAYAALGQLEKAVNLFKEILKKSSTHLPADDPVTLQAMFNLAWTYQLAGNPDQAMPLYAECLERQTEKLGADDVETLVTMNNVGLAYMDLGEFRKAQALFEKLLEKQTAQRGPDHFDTITTMGNLGLALMEVGDFQKAVTLMEPEFEKLKAMLGLDHPHTLAALNNLVQVYKALGQFDKALPLSELSLERRTVKFGPDHASTLLAMNNLATTYVDLKQPDRAIPLFERVLEIATRQLGPDHPYTLATMNNLAMTHRAAGQFEKALPLIQKALDMRTAKLGSDHPETLLSMNNLAMVYLDLHNWDKAVKGFRETMELQAAKLGPDHPATLTTMINLAKTYWDAGQVEAALPLYEQVVERRKTRLGPEDDRTLNVTLILAEAYHAAGKYDASSSRARDLLDTLRKTDRANGSFAANALLCLAMNLLKTQEFAEAEEHLIQSLAICERADAPDWVINNTRSLLGAALLGQEKYAEAETQLVQAFEGLKRCEAKTPAGERRRLVEAAERVVQLFEAWGKKEQADMWRTQLEALNQS